MRTPLARLAGLPKAVLRRCFGTREESAHSILAMALVVLSSVWFFSASDDRGRTARLSADAWYYHAYLPSLVFDQDLDFEDEYETTKNWYKLGKTDTGYQSNAFGIGPALYQLPFFVAGHGIAVVAGSQADGFSRPEVELSLYASLLFSLGGIFFCARLLRRRLGGRFGAFGVALLVACGGPVVYYAVRQPGYAHPFATFWAAWLVDYWDASFQAGQEKPRSRRFWIFFGLLVGAAALARPQLVLWSILGGYAAFSDVVRARAQGVTSRGLATLVGAWLLGAFCAFCVLLPQLLAWKTLNGGFFASPQGGDFMRWGQSAWLDTLMSSRNGLLPWAPLYALSGLGLLVGLRRHGRLCSALLLGLLLQAYVNGAAWDWWAGGSFGGRRFDSCLVAFAVGLGVLLLLPWREGRASRWLTFQKGVAIALCYFSLLFVGANLQLAARTSAPSARMAGGEAASAEILKTSSLFRYPAARASSLSNLPARLLYAWRNDVDLTAYDLGVGVHLLGELHPGVISFRGLQREEVDLDPASPLVRGLEPAQGGARVSPTGDVDLLFGLNRLGPVKLQVELVGGSGDSPTLHLNGERLATTETRTGTFDAYLENYARGSNRLSIHHAPGFTLLRVELSATVDAAGRPIP